MIGWPTQRLGDLVDKVGSGATPRGGEAAYQSTGIPLIRSMNVVFFGFKAQGLAHISEEQAAALDGATVAAGDVLLNITGASIGRATVAPDHVAGARVNQHVCIIRPNAALNARFLNAYLSSPAMQEQIWADNYGVTRQALTKQQILQFEVPVPPLAEQQRIADKLDTVLARVDACRNRLARVAPLLKRFRQSVLAAATSGQLTEDWREHQRTPPAAWLPVKLGDRVDRIEAGLNVSCDERPPEDGERGLVKISAVTWGEFDQEQSKTLRPGTQVGEAVRIRPGDFLISRANTLELVGACVIVRSVERRLYLSDKVLRLVLPDVDKHWLLYFLRSPLGRMRIEQLASGNQLSMRNLSQANLKSIEISWPPDDERDEIVRRIEVLFAFADRLEARLTQAQTAVDRLTPSLLAKAFRGELVPQDPNDEPASALLARIAAARSAAPPTSRTRSPRAGRPPRAPKESATMTKSRQDDDVMGQPYLAGHLRRIGTPATAEVLFKVAELPVGDFYKQLAWEVAQGHVKDNQTTLEPGHAAG